MKKNLLEIVAERAFLSSGKKRVNSIDHVIAMLKYTHKHKRMRKASAMYRVETHVNKLKGINNKCRLRTYERVRNIRSSVTKKNEFIIWTEFITIRCNIHH